MAKRRYRWITPEVRRAVIGLARQGVTYEDIKGRLDLPIGSISLVLRPLGGVLRVEQATPPTSWHLGEPA